MYQREESHQLEGDKKTVAMKCHSHSTAFSECFIYFKHRGTSKQAWYLGTARLARPFYTEALQCSLTSISASMRVGAVHQRRLRRARD